MTVPIDRYSKRLRDAEFYLYHSTPHIKRYYRNQNTKIEVRLFYAEYSNSGRDEISIFKFPGPFWGAYDNLVPDHSILTDETFEYVWKKPKAVSIPVEAAYCDIGQIMGLEKEDEFGIACQAPSTKQTTFFNRKYVFCEEHFIAFCNIKGLEL